MDVLVETSEIKMHAHEIENIVGTYWRCGKQADGKQNLSVEYLVEDKSVKLKAAKTLSKGAYSIELKFQGTLNDKMAGFYRSTYKTKDGEDKVMGTTQFEAVDARRAFPCWDEPSFKATFDMSLIIANENLTALSNMPVRNKTTLGDGSILYEYWRSPVMSTYLLAFIVGELESISAKSAGGTDFSVYTTPGKLSQAAFALDTGVKVLNFFEEYFGVRYPLPKQDMVGIPDFAAGAMENWGLITYRETALFATDDSSASDKQRVAYVIAHELAHQWFGNLVTMEWWSDLWLNEGFATWAGWLAIDNIFPHWDVWTNFTNDDAGYAMKTDALASSHAIQVTIGDPSEIDQVFDALSYNKGASMIRMIESHVGSDVFRLGLRNYIERHQYSNTLTADLWTAISECAGFNVAQIMDSWCLKVGFPVVKVESRDGNVLKLSQSRFFSGGEESKEDHLWSIPLHGCNEKGEVTSALFNSQKCDFTCGGEYVKLNAGQTSFVRVNYDEKGWKALQAPISSLALPAVDRLGVIMDAFALAKAGMMSTAVTLDLCKAYKNENCYPVWSALASGLSEVTEICSGAPFFSKYEEFCGSIFSDLMSTLGWNAASDDSDLTKKLRALCLGAAAKYGDKAVVTEALARFKAYADGGELDSDLRGVVFSTAVKFGGEDEFKKMLGIFEKVESPQLKMKALTSCGQTQDPELVKQYLEYAFSGKVRSNNVLYVLATLSSNAAARNIAWEYVKTNWKTKITPMFEGQHSLYAYCVVLPIRGFVTEEKAKEAEAFFKENPVPSATMKLSQTLENMRTKIAWLERENAALTSYFT